MNPSKDVSARAAQRKARLQQIELEQRLEEAEALRMTEDQRQALFESFVSVKVEFCDLDGLHWTKTALRKHTSSTRRPSAPFVAKPPSNGSAFAILTNADLATFTEDQTVRASVSPVKAAYPTDDLDLPPAKHRRRSCSRSRSPVKGLFTQSGSEGEPSTPHHTTRTPASAPASISVFSEPTTPLPVYTAGAPIERASTSRRKKSFSRTYSQTDIAFGVSSDVVSEVMRGRAPTRRADVKESNDFVESSIPELGTVRRGPPVAAPPRPPSRLGGPRHSSSRSHSRQVSRSTVRSPVTPVPVVIGTDDDEEEEDGSLMTPTPARFTSAVEYPDRAVSPSPIPPVPAPAASTLAPPRDARTRASSGPLKRKRVPGSGVVIGPLDLPPLVSTVSQ